MSRATAAIAWFMLLAVAACTPSDSGSDAETTSTTETTVIAPLFPEDDEPPRRPATTTTTLAPLDVGRAMTVARLEADLLALLEIGPRAAGTRGERLAGDWIITRLDQITALGDEGGVSALRYPTIGAEWTRNIRATVRARPPEAPTWVMLVAPYDSAQLSPGIDANGSGVAVLLELATRLADEPLENVFVTFTFLGADSGSDRIGSSREADRLAALPDYVVSVDTVGVGSRVALRTASDDLAILGRLERSIGQFGLGVDRVVDEGSHTAFANRGAVAFSLSRSGNARAATQADTATNSASLHETVEILDTLLRILGQTADS